MLYSECVKCNKLGIECDGPNFFTLPAHDILEWCKARKKFLNLSNDKIADLSGVPKGTVARVFAGEHEDFKFATVQPILRVLIGGTYHRESCPDANGNAAAKIAELENKNISLLRVIKENKAAYDADLKRERSDAEQRIREKKNTVIVLSIALAVCVAFIAVLLLIDLANHDKSFFWLEHVRTGVQSTAAGLYRLIFTTRK